MSKYQQKQSQTQPNNEPQELDYEKLGVAPPTREEHGSEEQIEQIFRGLSGRMHDWRMQGTRLYCVACNPEHGEDSPRFVEYILQGTDERGLPILKHVGTMQP